MARFPIRPLAAYCLLAAGFAGCSPQPGPGLTDDVIEIEEIEMDPRPHESVAESGAETRREVDAEKAAADRAIDEAARSIEPPPPASDSQSAPEPVDPSQQPEPKTDQ